MENVRKLSMCRICLVESVRMCVVTNKSLQEMYEKLTDVPFVTEDHKPMLVCLFCCTRLKQCCQLQRKCVEAEELLAQMLSEDYEQKPMNRGHLGFVGGFITTPIENISIVDDFLIASDAIKQEPPAVCEEQDNVELQLAHYSEELEPENLYNSHPDVEAHYSESESEEKKIVMEIKIEKEDLPEKLSVREMEKLELENVVKSYPGDEDIPAHDEFLIEIKTKAEEDQGVSKRKRRARGTQRATVAKKPTLKRKLEDTVPAKQMMNVLSDSKITRTTKTSTSESVAKIKESITSTFQNRFSQSSNLIQHTRIHPDEKRFICDICQSSFSNKRNLTVHYRKHFGEKPFKCDVCQRSFTESGSLKQHMRIHTGVKPYKCDVCERSFTTKSSLTVHFRKHSGERPFKCDICQRSFTQATNLKLHIRIHTGERPYKCDVCHQTFISNVKLSKHNILVHTSEKPYIILNYLLPQENT